MQIRRNEITTGLLVIFALGVVLAILVAIGMPGVLSSVKTYRIYFDNASGIRPGSLVLLAGREIGKVVEIESPIPIAKRPKGRPDYEVAIIVKVDDDAPIYTKTTVQLKQQTLMGTRVIDFFQGDEKSKLAPSNSEFVGERTRDVSETINEGITRLTGQGSDLAATLRNAKEFTDTIKREPWRLFWPSTKEYPEDLKKEEEKKLREKREQERKELEKRAREERPRKQSSLDFLLKEGPAAVGI